MSSNQDHLHPASDNLRHDRRQYTDQPRYPNSINRRKQQRPMYMDLREKLNDMRREQATAPPPDPSYNFLRDPARDFDSNETSKFNSPRQPSKGMAYNKPAYPSDGRRETRNRPTESQTIQPVNIKIEVFKTTGIRSCTVDENIKLPELKHVPDRPDGDYVQKSLFYYRNPQRSRGGREKRVGRGAFNQQRYQNANENQQNHQRNPINKRSEEEESWDVPPSQDARGAEQHQDRRTEYGNKRRGGRGRKWVGGRGGYHQQRNINVGERKETEQKTNEEEESWDLPANQEGHDVQTKASPETAEQSNVTNKTDTVVSEAKEGEPTEATNKRIEPKLANDITDSTGKRRGVRNAHYKQRNKNAFDRTQPKQKTDESEEKETNDSQTIEVLEKEACKSANAESETNSSQSTELSETKDCEPNEAGNKTDEEKVQNDNASGDAGTEEINEAAKNIAN